MALCPSETAVPTAIDEHIAQFERRDWRHDVTETVRFAVIGLGWWTVDEAIPALAAADHCRVTVAGSGSAEKAEPVADGTASIDDDHDQWRLNPDLAGRRARTRRHASDRNHLRGRQPRDDGPDRGE